MWSLLPACTVIAICFEVMHTGDSPEPAQWHWTCSLQNCEVSKPLSFIKLAGLRYCFIIMKNWKTPFLALVCSRAGTPSLCSWVLLQTLGLAYATSAGQEFSPYTPVLGGMFAMFLFISHWIGSGLGAREVIFFLFQFLIKLSFCNNFRFT